MTSRRNALARIAALGLAAGLPSAYAQRIHRVGVLINGSERSMSRRLDALRSGLKAQGYVEGRNLVFIVRWNDSGLVERLPDLAADLLRERPDVVVAAPVLSAAAVQKHSRTVPVVIGWGSGAVKIGLAKSWARPGSNVTGLDGQYEDLTDKHLELLKDIAPTITKVGVLNTGTFLFHEEAWTSAAKAARVLGLTLIDLRIDDPSLARVESTCGSGRCDGLYVMPDPVLNNWRGQVIAVASRLRVPAVYPQPDFVREGGLMSYSADLEEMMRRAAVFVDKILKGAKPADLPIERPTRFELIVNLKTAKTLGIKVPREILIRADRVIE